MLSFPTFSCRSLRQAKTNENKREIQEPEIKTEEVSKDLRVQRKIKLAPSMRK
jgi:hypothetical protein